MFTTAFWRNWDLPIGFVLFCKVYYKHLVLLAKLEDSTPFLRIPLSIVLSGAFQKIIRSRRKHFPPCSLMIWIACPFLSNCGYPVLLPGCLIIWPLVWRRSCVLIPRNFFCDTVPWFPSDEGVPKYFEGLLCSYTQLTGNSAP